jgi:SAM-dependent methyltransferase
MRANYILDQRGAERAERERLALVERHHDPITVRVLERLGIGPGWRCLDVGSGSGSIAGWLAERVGPDGEVTATDLDIRLLEPLAAAGVDVVRSDIVSGPPPTGVFDLVHARLLLIHLPERERAAWHLVAAAGPGCPVVVGDIDFTTFEPIERWPGWNGVWDSFLLAVEHAGWDVACGRRLSAILSSVGLEEIEVEAIGGSARGGDLPCELFARTLERLCDRLLAMDVSPSDIARSLAELRSPARTFALPTIWTAWGRRPHGPSTTQTSGWPPGRTDAAA